MKIKEVILIFCMMLLVLPCVLAGNVIVKNRELNVTEEIVLGDYNG